MAAKIKSVEERIKNKIKITENGCWEWQGYVLKSGYAQMSVNNKSTLIHRATYELYKGKIPDGLLACHTCDNKICCNPNHIFLGTYKDNMQDAQKKGKMKAYNHPSYSYYANGCRCEDCRNCMREYIAKNQERIKYNYQKRISKKNTLS